MRDERCINLADRSPVDAVKEGMSLKLVDIETLLRCTNQAMENE